MIDGFCYANRNNLWNRGGANGGENDGGASDLGKTDLDADED